MWKRVIPGVVVLSCILGCFGGDKKNDAGSSGNSTKQEKKLPTLDELKKQLVGKSMEEVKSILGKPNSTTTILGDDAWEYTRICYDPISEKAKVTTTVWFSGKTKLVEDVRD